MSLASVPGSHAASPMASLALLVSKTPQPQGGRRRWARPWEAGRGHRQHPGIQAATLSPSRRALGSPYPVGLCGDVLRAVRDLRLAAVQDAPDDRNAGHLLPATDQVLRLLKGHYPAGCRGPGQRSGGPGLGPFSTPTLPPPSPAQTPGVCSSASPPPTP